MVYDMEESDADDSTSFCSHNCELGEGELSSLPSHKSSLPSQKSRRLIEKIKCRKIPLWSEMFT